jgi:recombination protein RecA
MAKKKEKKTEKQPVKIKVNPDGTRDLNGVIGAINEKFGEGTIALAKDVKAVAIRRIPTASFYHDVMVGGGTYMGGIVEISGPYQSGKTWLAVKTGAINQKLCNRCNAPFIVKAKKRVCPLCVDYEERVLAFIDAENSAMTALAKDGWVQHKEKLKDKEYCKNTLFRFFKALGVDLDRLLYYRPDDTEEAFEVADMLIKSRTANVIILDSVAASLTGEEVSKHFDEGSMAVKARLNNKFVRKIITRFNEGSLVDPNNVAWCSLILINQLSTDIGGGYKPGMPDFVKQKPSGGLGIGYMALERIRIKRAEKLTIKKEFFGFEVYADALKDKQGSPFVEFEFNIFVKDCPSYGIKKHEIDEKSEILKAAFTLNYFHQKGGWFTFNNQRFQGKDKLVDFIFKNKKYIDKVKRELLAMKKE